MCNIKCVCRLRRFCFKIRALVFLWKQSQVLWVWIVFDFIMAQSSVRTTFSIHKARNIKNSKYKIFYFGQIKILRQFLWELHWRYIENREKQEVECWRNFDFEKFLLLRKMSYYSAKLMDNLVIQFVWVFLSVGLNLVFLLKARSKTNKRRDKWRCFG